MKWKAKTSSQQQLCSQEHLVDQRDDRRMARLVQVDRMATITWKAACYKWGEQKSILECTTCQTFWSTGYSSTPHRFPLLSAKDRNQRLDTMDASSPNRHILKLEIGCIVWWICNQQHESGDPACLVAGRCGVIAWEMFYCYTFDPLLLPIYPTTAYLTICIQFWQQFAHLLVATSTMIMQ